MNADGELMRIAEGIANGELYEWDRTTDRFSAVEDRRAVAQLPLLAQAAEVFRLAGAGEELTTVTDTHSATRTRRGPEADRRDPGASVSRCCRPLRV